MRISLSAIHKHKVAYNPILFYLAAGLPVLLPLLTPGYILVLDMVFAPHIPMPQELINTYPFYALLHFLNVLIPAWVIQKILVLSIFTGAGMGAFTLMRSLEPKDQDKISVKSWLLASYVAGVFYIYNPFVYTRLMAGQYLVLIGYALLPFFAQAIWAFAHKPTRKNSFWVIGLTTAIAVTSIHTLVVAIILAIVALAVSCFSYEARTQWRRLAAYSLAILGVVTLLNSFWLIPVATGTSSLSNTALSFSSEDLAAFATVPGDLGTIGNLLALQGFWGDEKNLYLLPQDLYSWWLLPLILLWTLSIVGAVWGWRHQRSLFVMFTIGGVIGLVLASGTSGTIFTPLNQWLADHIPLFAGYREPQKATMLIALAYAYFIACGSFTLVRRCKQHKERLVATSACVLLVVACVPMFIWGGRGQLRAQDYPHDWYIANQTLNAQRHPGDKALFLPWHLYQPFTFSSGTVATPAEAFFDIPVISSKDPELDGASPYKNDTMIKKMSELLREATEGQARPRQAAQIRLSEQLLSHGIRYILVSKNYDYKMYDFLGNTQGTAVISDSPTLTIYRVGR
jgi:hypothetical protein